MKSVQSLAIYVNEESISSMFYERLFRTKNFFLVTFWQKKHFRTKNTRVKRWWNWRQEDCHPTSFWTEEEEFRFSVWSQTLQLLVLWSSLLSFSNVSTSKLSSKLIWTMMRLLKRLRSRPLVLEWVSFFSYVQIGRYRVCHVFRLTKQDDYIWFDFNHF